MEDKMLEEVSGLDVQELLIDAQRESRKSVKRKDKIIMLLIIFLFLEPILLISGFMLYESQYEYVETYDTTEETSIDVDASGEKANAEYNDVEGNQYNGSSVHNEGGASD